MALNSPFTTVDPTRPVAPWLGGKRNLARRICAMIDAVPHTTYAEAFVGIGGMPEVREIFGRFALEEVKVSYTIGNKADRAPVRGEPLIMDPG